MKLKNLDIGKSAIINNVGGSGALRQHLFDMGVIPNAEVTMIKYAPMGDPIEIRVQNYELTLRLADAENIEVTPIDVSQKSKKVAVGVANGKSYAHPGYGENGRFHTKATERPLPKGTTLTFALAGNQNSGKTTLFNQLTGSNQHVGNFPGVTVDKKSGAIKGYAQTEVTDLPGIYSLSPYTSEEVISRQFILGEKPTGIINIVDATSIERNLYLTLQLMELNIPVVLALNMMDELTGNGGSVDVNVMEQMLGIPVVPISASKNEGVDELIKHAVHIAKYQELPTITDFCSKDLKGGAVHRCLHSIMHLIEGQAEAEGIPVRFAACKLVEGDESIFNGLKLSQNQKTMIEHIILQMEAETGIDRSAAIADMRFSFIQKVCEATFTKPEASKEHIRSNKIDKILTGKFTAIPSFVAIMALIFWITFGTVGVWLQDLLDNGIQLLTNFVDTGLTAINVNGVLRSLIIDGVFAGVGSVLSFVPVIVILFFFLSILEDSGYMARVAFVMDKLLRKIGLSGRSIVPMIIGFGCSVPSIMASRTLPSERDRKMTIMLTPFMSCTAKLPVYSFFALTFFPKHSAIVIIGMYLIGILVAIFTALAFKNTVFKGEAVPFVMELPNYRMPTAKNVGRLLWDKTKDFVQRAFTLIFLASILVWFLQSFDFSLNLVSDSQYSILATISGFIAPIFKPLGFGDWRVVTGLVAGFIAKESVVSTICVLIGGADALLSSMSVVSVLALLVFCLLYTPCVAAIAAVKKELGFKWAFGMVALQCIIAWICALFVRALGLIICLIL